MAVLALLDTNVLVSALITKNANSPTVRVVRALLNGTITPLYHEDILAEYKDVLTRPKFHLNAETIKSVFTAIEEYGVQTEPTFSDLDFPDEDDRIFYEVTLSREQEGARLVTGNKRHFPVKKFVVTPAEMAEILGI